MEREELFLCGLLREALTGEIWQKREAMAASGVDWEGLILTAQKHNVLSLLYDVLEEEKKLPEAERLRLEHRSREIVQQNYRLLFLSRYLVRLLEEQEISVIVLKGSSTAAFYPVPELRKSGDIDLLFQNRKDAERAAELLCEAGFTRKKRQEANHHIGCVSPDGIEVELHQMLTEPFDSKKTNGYLEQCQKSFFAGAQRGECMGVELPVLPVAYHAFYLLLHMLQHFLRSGFGLKLLCDWTVLWNRTTTERDGEQFLGMVQECGLLGFARMITAVCVRYLGLSLERVAFMNISMPEQKSDAEALMQEILEAGEFGKAKKDRMVVLRGTKPKDYVREFHHQMKLTYPKAGKCPLLYPVLWCMLLMGFLHRNRTVRRVSGRAILRKAARRSGLAERMRIFKE